ncbi:acyl-CoA dehydrogenase family protein [Actinosynnema sp. CS-041913]|uniref:acyl-CoA dehydrogenase family protein n=1 Tax=Actinosynnema sp. CS-041913 TaxID=3239917 RepID=UPI003D945863
MTAGGTWPDADAIASAADLAGRDAADSDAAGGIGNETVEALTAAGFPGCFVPRRFGGGDATFAAVTKAVAAVGEGCASAAWIASLSAYNGRFGAYLPVGGQEEVWAKGPDTRLVSSMVAAGVEAEPVDGGWSLSGRWLYVSGVEFADWALVSSAPPREGDRSVLVFAVPGDSFTYLNTWSTVGMNATGSHTLVVERAFVPECRTFVWDDMRRGVLSGPGTTAQSASLFSVNGLTFAAPILGAARGALRLAERHLADRPSGARAASRESSLIAFTRAAGEIDAAELLLSRVADTADLGGLADGRAERSHRDSTLAVEILVGAVDRLFRVTGTRGQGTSHAMQRIWRDVHAAASHAALQFEPAALAYTRGLVTG